MSLVKNLKIDGEVYDIRDDSALRSLSEEQKATLLNEGSYNGSDVTDGEIFTEDSGKFVEFDKTLKDAGVWETYSSDMTLSTLSGVSNVAEGNGAIVIACNSKGAVSYDGRNWETYSVSGLAENIVSFIFDGTRFVCYGSSKVFKSTDGKNWTTETVSSGPAYHTIVYFSYDDGRYVIIVKDKTIWTSKDAVVWSQIGTLPSSLKTSPLIVRRADGVYLALDSYKYVSTSTDAVEWTEPVKSNLPDSSAYGSPRGLVSVGNVFTTVLYSSSGRLYWSEDGITWTAGTPSSSISGVSGIVKRGNKVFTTGERITYIYVSEDGKTFTKLNENFPSKYLTAIAYGSGKTCVFYASAYTSPTDVQLAIKADAPYYEYSLINLSYSKEEVDAAIAGVDLTAYTKNLATGSGSFSLNTAISYVNATSYGVDSKVTGGGAVAIGNNVYSRANAVAIGQGASAGENDVVIGMGSSSNATNNVYIGQNRIANSSNTGSSVAIGNGPETIKYIGSGCVLVGRNAYTTSADANFATAIGYEAICGGSYAIQLGRGTNNTANTMSVGLSDSLNVQLLDTNGKIPVERLPEDIGGATSLEDIAFAGSGIKFTNPVVANHIASGNIAGSPTISTEGIITNMSSSKYLNIDGASIPGWSGSLFTGNYSWAWTVKFKTSSDTTKEQSIFRLGNSLTSFNVWCALSETNSAAPGRIAMGIHLSNNTWSNGSLHQTGSTVLKNDSWYYLRLSRDTSTNTYKLELSEDGEHWNTEISFVSSLGLYNTYAILYVSSLFGSSVGTAEYDLKGFKFTSNYGSGIDWTAYEYSADKTEISSTALMNYSSDSLNRGVVIKSPDGTTRISADSGAVNLANGYVVRVGYNAQCGGGYGTAVGYQANAGNSYGTALGYATATGDRCVSIGAGATSNTKTTATGNRAVAVGAEASASSTEGISLGYRASSTASSAIQIGQGTNNTANTFQVGSYQMLDANGKIPAERLVNAPVPDLTEYTTRSSFTGSNGISMGFKEVSDYTLVGTLTVSDGVVSGYTTQTTNYLQVDNRVTQVKPSSYEIGCAFAVASLPSSVSGGRILSFSIIESETGASAGIAINASGILQAVGPATLTGTTVFATGTKVYAKLTYDSTTGYVLYSSTDGVTWNREASKDSPTFATGGANMFIGRFAAQINPTIYLKDCYAIVDGIEVWRGYSEKMVAELEAPKQDGTAPSETTVGYLGQVYIDTTSSTAYMCVGVSSGSYTWKQITA